MIDFSLAAQKLNTYDGAAAKIKIEYEGKIYMLKFDESLVPNEKNQHQASYSNTTVSEYLGCHIFNSCCFSFSGLGLCVHDIKEFVLECCHRAACMNRRELIAMAEARRTCGYPFSYRYASYSTRSFKRILAG